MSSFVRKEWNSEVFYHFCYLLQSNKEEAKLEKVLNPMFHFVFKDGICWESSGMLWDAK
jgi:hypothetical protein